MNRSHIARQLGQSERAVRRLAGLHLLMSLVMALAFDAAAVLLWGLTGWSDAGLVPVLAGLNLLAVVGLLLGARLELTRLETDPAVMARRLGASTLDTLDDPLHRRLQNLLEELSIAAHIGVPRAFVLNSETAIDLVTLGVDRTRTVVIATRGALTRLSREELRGALAHELAHIVNGDTHLHTHLLGLNHGLRRLLGWPGFRAARVIEAGAGLQREFAADALAVELARGRRGLADALRKVAGWQLMQSRLPRGASGPTSVWWQALALARFAEGGHRRDAGPVHPSVTERIRRLLGEPAAPVVPTESFRSDINEPALPSFGVCSEHEPLSECERPHRIRLNDQLYSLIVPGEGEQASQEPPESMLPGVSTFAASTATHEGNSTAVIRLVRATREPAGAAALVVALLDRGRGAPAWGRDWLVAAQRFGAVRAALEELPHSTRSTLRWPLLELAAGCLRPLAESSREALLSIVRERVQHAGVPATRDWIDAALLRRRLGHGVSLGRSDFGEPTDARSVRVLFAVLAQEARLGDARADRAANAAIRALDLASIGGFGGELTLDALEAAIARTADLPPLAKSRLAEHLAGMLPATVDPSTQECLRLLCLCIDCPGAVTASPIAASTLRSHAGVDPA
jgi:heat shock protein HtpX